jgi:hypothetical protein
MIHIEPQELALSHDAMQPVVAAQFQQHLQTIQQMRSHPPHTHLVPPPPPHSSSASLSVPGVETLQSVHPAHFQQPLPNAPLNPQHEVEVHHIMVMPPPAGVGVVSIGGAHPPQTGDEGDKSHARWQEAPPPPPIVCVSAPLAEPAGRVLDNAGTDRIYESTAGASPPTRNTIFVVSTILSLE